MPRPAETLTHDWPSTRSKTVSGDADMATVPGSSSAGGPVLEVLAHERLMPALRSAFEYVLAVCVCVSGELLIVP